jgi:tyrosinase
MRKGQSTVRHKPEPVTMAMPTTFAEELRLALPELRERLKLPLWLQFLFVHDRKDQAKLTDTEKARFICAINTLIANGTYGSLVAIHADMSHMMHRTQRFLPWHRVYLIQLEQAIQAIHPDVTIPYWDWTQAAEETVPAWLASFTPTVPMPSGPSISVLRSPGTSADLAVLASNIPNIIAAGTFVDFWRQIEGVHNAVHVWVGGSMGSIPTAPADPIFWMHHANCDRLWSLWQKAHPGINPDLAGAGLSTVMDPWATTEADTRDIEAMGYDYV